MANNVTAEIRSGNECSKIELAAFHALALQSGEVQSEGLPALIAQAERLLFLLHPQAGLIGISALKHPRDSYRAKVFAAAATRADPTSFNLELGWIYLLEKRRGGGLSSWLIDLLLDHAADQPVFATCRTNNEAMNFILPKHGFQRSGNSYPSANGQHEINLFLRPPT